MKLNFKELRHALTHGTALVTFTKADKTERVMECTLAPYLLPETTQEPTHTGEDTMIVFDLEKEAWRSFRYDRVTNIEIL